MIITIMFGGIVVGQVSYDDVMYDDEVIVIMMRAHTTLPEAMAYCMHNTVAGMCMHSLLFKGNGVG